MPYLERLGPKIVKYIEDEHPKSDKIMVIGCLAEVFNNCPTAISTYFDGFMQILIKHSVTTDGSMNRNVSYAMGILAVEAPDKFAPHVDTVMTCIKNMHTASEEEDAKDNCIASLVRIIERHGESIPNEQKVVLFEQIMSAIPLTGDPSENETILKFIMNVNASDP